jgi:phosphoglycolate phosphatase-like HAD superfamily hydrolase
VTQIARARELVLRLRREGYQLALATAANARVLRPLLEIAEVADLVAGSGREIAEVADLVAGSGREIAEVADLVADLVDAAPPKPDASKPDPAAIEAALSQVDVDRSRVVLIGDTPYDVEAGRAAHVDVLGVTSGGYSGEALAGAIAVYRGPSELLARWRESPLGSRSSAKN